MRHPKAILRGLLLALMAAAVGLVAAAPADAQNPPPQQPPQEQPAIDVDDETLTLFARAYLEVREISMEVEPEIQNAESMEEAQELQQEASERMQEAVEEEDLTIEEYSQIAASLNSDEELRERFEEVVAELQEEDGGGGPIR